MRYLVLLLPKTKSYLKLQKHPVFAKDIVPLIKKGWTIGKIAKKLDKTSQAIYDALERDGVDLAKLRKQIKEKQ